MPTKGRNSNRDLSKAAKKAGYLADLETVLRNYSKKVRLGILPIRKFAAKAPYKFGSLLLFSIVVISLIFEAGEDKTVIGKFSIPKSLVDRGYTPDVFGLLIYDKIEQAKINAKKNLQTIENDLPTFRDSLSIPKSNEREVRVIAQVRTGSALNLLLDTDGQSGVESFATQEFNITVPGTGIEIKNLIPWLTKRIGLPVNTKEIAGEIICKVASCEASSLSINIRYDGLIQTIPAEDAPVSGMPDLIQQAADQILYWKYPKEKFLAKYFETLKEQEASDVALEELLSSINRISKKEDFKTYSLLGIIFTHERNYLPADYYFSLASIIDDTSNYNNLVWVHSLIFLEQFEKARDKFESAIAGLDVDESLVDPFREALMIAVINKLEREFNKLEIFKKDISLPTQGSVNADDFFQAGMALYEQDDFDKAIEQLKKATDLAPGEQNYWTALGNVYYVKGVNDLAIAAYLEANALDPNILNNLINLGDSYYDLGEYDMAIEYYEKALDIDSNDSWTLTSLGNAYYSLGLFSEALENYQKVINLDPTSGFNYFNLAEVYFAIGDFDKALEFFQNAEEFGLSSSYFYRAWGNALIEMGRDADAKEKYNKANEVFEQTYGADVVGSY